MTSSSTIITTTNTNWWVPTQIITYQETTTLSASATTATASETSSVAVPQAIAGDSSSESTPVGYSAITVAFKKAMNYNFLLTSPQSSAQIFSFLPQTLISAFTETAMFNNVSVIQLLPYTDSSKDYTVTFAQVYFPSEEIANLQQLLSDPSSALYTDAPDTERTLASLIDPAYPITGMVFTSSANEGASQSTGGNNSGNGNSPARSGSSSNAQSTSGGSSSSDNGNANGASDDSASQDYGTLGYFGKTTNANGGSGSKLSKKKIIAIVVVVVVGSLAYFAAMGYMIRRYIQHTRKQPVIQLPINDDSTASLYSNSGSNRSSTLNEKAMAGIAEKDNEDVVSLRINEWMNEAHYGKNEHTLNDYQAQEVAQIVRDISRPKISRPIASENSLGWNDV